MIAPFLCYERFFCQSFKMQQLYSARDKEWLSKVEKHDRGYQQ